MRHYNAKLLEFTKPGFTDLHILSVANLPATIGGAPVNDFANGLNAQTVTLKTLNPGDVVEYVVVDIKTPLAGPTGAPTVQINVATAGTNLTGTIVANAAATLGGISSPSQGNAYLQAADTLVAAFAAGGGNGAVPTAGEIWIWSAIFSAQDRQLLQG